MMLLDSNIVIYLSKPEYSRLHKLVGELAPAVSAISYVEVLGYHKLGENDHLLLLGFFSNALMLPVTMAVIERATLLRQARKMSLGDALIAATALLTGRTLVTHNLKDFDWIDGLVLLDPLNESTPS